MVDYMMVRHMQYFLSNKSVAEHNQKFVEKNGYEALNFARMDFARLYQHINWRDKKFNWLILVGKKLSLQELNKYYLQLEAFIVESCAYIGTKI